MRRLGVRLAVWIAATALVVLVPATLLLERDVTRIAARHADAHGRAIVEETRVEVREVMVGVTVTLVVLGVTLGLVLGRRVSDPVRRMARTADALAVGDYAMRARILGKDELAELGSAFDRMADGLVERLDAARAQEARLSTILDSMVEGVLVTDGRGRIVRANAAITKLTGTSPLGRSVIEAVRSPELDEAVGRALAGQREPSNVELTLPNGRSMLVAYVSSLPARAGGGVVAVLHDVTDLRRADTVRRDFVANASHELRTPLTAIRGYAETLRDGALDNPELARKFLGIVIEHSLRLERLVQDLLELSRAESPDAGVELGPVRLAPLVNKVLRGLEEAAAKRSVTTSSEGVADDLEVRGDERALEHVLGNLVDNAIKYDRIAGRVAVRAAVEGDRVVIEVADTGPGIAATHLPRIFERFYRVDPGRSRDAGGTGLGLAIVKHHVQRMGGEVDVVSTVGQGTTFRVRLPVSR